MFLLPHPESGRERLQIESIIERAGESEAAERFREECLLVKVYAQICSGRALQSEQSCIQQQRLHILSEALKVNHYQCINLCLYHCCSQSCVGICGVLLTSEKEENLCSMLE